MSNLGRKKEIDNPITISCIYSKLMCDTVKKEAKKRGVSVGKMLRIIADNYFKKDVKNGTN